LHSSLPGLAPPAKFRPKSPALRVAASKKILAEKFRGKCRERDKTRSSGARYILLAAMPRRKKQRLEAKCKIAADPATESRILTQ